MPYTVIMSGRHTKLSFFGSVFLVSAAIFIGGFFLYLFTPTAYFALFVQVVIVILLMPTIMGVVFLINGPVFNWFMLPKKQRKFFFSHSRAMMRMRLGFGRTEDFLNLLNYSRVMSRAISPREFLVCYRRNINVVPLEVWSGMLEVWGEQNNVYVAKHEDTPVSVLKLLLETGSFAIRSAAIGNPNLPEELKVYGVLLGLKQD